MMMPTELLKEEHDLILVMLKIVEIVCEKLQRGDRVDTGHLEGILDFIHCFADRCHTTKEEKVLFPALEAADVPHQDAAVSVLMHEHDLGRNYVKVMAEALENMKGGDTGAAKDFAKSGRGYAELLRNHIAKENDILFEMADQNIHAEERIRICAEFAHIEKMEAGEGVHEKYHALLYNLRDVYLPG